MAIRLNLAALSRLKLYVEVVGWLISHAIQRSLMTVFVSCGLILISIAVQVFAVLMTAQLIARLAPSAGEGVRMPALPDFVETYLASLSATHMAALVGALFLLSTVLLFFGRLMTLWAESAVIDGAGSAGIKAFNSFNAKRPKELAINPVAKVIATGSRSGGRIVRMILRSIAAVAQLFVGLAILVAISPMIFIVLAVAIVVGIALNYPLSLASYRTAQKFEVVSTDRRQGLRHHLGAIEKTGKAFPLSKDLEAAQHSFTATLRRRLGIQEVSSLVFGLFFGLAIGVLLYLLATGSLTDSFKVESLFILVVTFRYIFLGYQGIMVLITKTNRFIPSSVLLHQMVTTGKIPGPQGNLGSDDDDDDDE